MYARSAAWPWQLKPGDLPDIFDATIQAIKCDQFHLTGVQHNVMKTPVSWGILNTSKGILNTSKGILCRGRRHEGKVQPPGSVDGCRRELCCNRQLA